MAYKHILPILVLSLLVLPACSLTTQPAEDLTVQTQQQQPELRQGTVERVLMSAARKGTHTLTQTDGKEIFLKSKTENLNNYVDEQVEVRGLISIDGEGDEIMEVTAIKRAGEEEIVEESDTFVKEEFPAIGIAIGYPELLQAFSNSTSLSFSYSSTTTSERVHISFVYDGNLQGRTLRAYVTAKDTAASFEEVRLGVHEGFRKKSATGTNLEFYVAHESSVYRIDFTEEKSTRNWKNYFYQMLDTLQFIERVEVMEETAIRGDSTSRPGSTEVPSVSSDNLTSPPTSSSPSVTETSSTTPAREPKEPTIAPTPVPEAVPSPTTSGTTTQQRVSSYLTKNVDSLQLGTNVKLRGFSFVEPNYVYVTYMEGEDRKRVLYQYEAAGDSVTTKTVGSFVAGTDRDWERVEGENPVAAKEQTVYAVDGTTVKETATVKQGYRLMESASQGYGMQIPANWYYRSLGGGKMGFATTPVEEDNVQAALQISSGGLGLAGGTATTVGDKKATVDRQTNEAGESVVTISVDAGNGKVYSLSGPASEEQMYRAMLETLQIKE